MACSQRLRKLPKSCPLRNQGTPPSCKTIDQYTTYPFLSKLPKVLLTPKMTKYLNCYKLPCFMQYGFLPGFSTDLANKTFVDRIRNHLHSRKYSFGPIH